MNTAHFPKFLSALLLGFVMPAQAYVESITCGGIGGRCNIIHIEDCIMLQANGSHHTERCSVHSFVSGFLEPKPTRQVVYAIHMISFGKNPATITYDVRNSAKFYVNNAFQRSEKAEDGYLCFPDTRPDTAICISSAIVNKMPFERIDF